MNWNRQSPQEQSDTKSQPNSAKSVQQNEWQAFDGDSGTLGIPRAEMPQVKAEHRGPMVNFLNARSIEHREEQVPADTLKPTQAEFSLEKVARAAENTDSDRSILVSNDGYVVDGHHQWLAAKEKGESVKTIVLDAPVKKLLPLLHEFPSSLVDTSSAGVKENRENVKQNPVSVQENAPEVNKTGKDVKTGATKTANVQQESERDFVPSPEGGYNFGEITPAIANVLGRQAGKIRLRRGNEAWGLIHLQNRHGEQFRLLGFASPEEFVASVAREFNATYRREGRSLDLVVDTGKTGRRLMVQLEPSEDGDFYDVKTASPVRSNQFKNRTPLWVSTGTSTTTSETGSPSPWSQSGTNNVPPVAADGKETSANSPSNEGAKQEVTAPEYGANNKLVSQDRAAELRKKLKAKFSQLSSGIDPEILAIGTELAVFHIEASARKFAAFAKAMAADLDMPLEKLRPYLRSWYNGARDMMEDSNVSIEGMDNADTVRSELARLDAEAKAQQTPPPATHRSLPQMCRSSARTARSWAKCAASMAASTAPANRMPLRLRVTLA